MIVSARRIGWTRLLAGMAVCAGVCLSAAAGDLYFSIDDDANKYWDYAPGWRANKGTPGVLPTTNDTTTFNSTYLDINRGRTPLTITNGIEAAASTCWIGSLAQSDRRVIGLKIAGGSLAVARTDHWDALTVGHAKDGYGLLDIESGRVSSEYFIIGREGCGVVTNRGGFICTTNWDARLVIGSEATGEGRLVQTDGAIGGHNSDQLARTVIAVGHQGHGTLELVGGVISNRVALGTETGGRGEMFVSGGSLLGQLDVGSHANATGRVDVTGGAVSDAVKVGINGYGIAVFDAPAQRTGSFYLGSEAGSLGIVTNFQSICQKGNGCTLYAGIYGEGHFHAKANVTMDYMKISASTNVTSTMTVYAGATNFVGVQVCVGGSVFPASMKQGAEANFDVPGHGEYVLKGGAIKFTDGNYSSQNLLLGRTATNPDLPDTWGILRGYGDVLPGGVNHDVTNVRMAIGVGKVIADGEGEERTLSLNAVVNVTNTVPTGVDGTSGWYARNKGGVLFPRTWYGSGTTFTRSFGDAPYATQPGLVNSLTFTIRQPSQGANYFRGGVYATDRSDLYLDALPPNDGIVGCWKLGVFDGLTGTGKRTFTDVSLTFRYDAVKAPTKRRFSLWRHNGTSWARVGRAVRQDGEIPRISTASALTPATGTFNVGTFAVTADKAGMTILFR